MCSSSAIIPTSHPFQKPPSGSHDILCLGWQWQERLTAEKSNLKNRQAHLWCLEMQMLRLLLSHGVVRTIPWYVSSCGRAPLKTFLLPQPWLWFSILLIVLVQLNQWNYWDLLKEVEALEKPGPSIWQVYSSLTKTWIRTPDKQGQALLALLPGWLIASPSYASSPFASRAIPPHAPC